MKRSALKRGTKPLKRRAKLKAKGRPRFKQGRDAKYLAWIRTLPCTIRFGPLPCRPYLGIHAAHIQSRGAGGADRANTVPLCSGHHAESHTIGIRSFQKLYGVDLKAEAERLAKLWEGDEEAGRVKAAIF